MMAIKTNEISFCSHTVIKILNMNVINDVVWYVMVVIGRFVLAVVEFWIRGRVVMASRLGFKGPEFDSSARHFIRGEEAILGKHHK